MAIKCFRCGTMFTGIECPTCKQRKLSEERNRLLQEQNKKIEHQNRELERQTNIAEQEQRQRELERSERQFEIEREEKNEEFNSRVEELYNYAIERNLTTAFVCFQSYISSIIDQTTFYEWGELGISYYGIEKILMEKCLRKFIELKQKLDDDDRIIDCGKYGKYFSSKIKLGLIKQITNSHNEDYVILPQPDQSLLIFPTNLVISNSSTKGYENKDIQIGEFQYLMFLHNADEAKKIAQTLSDASKRIKRIYFIVDEVKKIISEYITNTPKPQPVKPKEHKSVSGTLAIICSIIGILAGYFIVRFLGESVLYFFSCPGGLVVGGKIGYFIGDKIDKKAEEKIWQQNKASDEVFEKTLSDWKTNLNKIINGYINKQSFDDVSGKFLMIKDKGISNES